MPAVDTMPPAPVSTITTRPGTTTKAVCFEQAVAVIGPFPVLAGVDLVVEQGQVVLVQGPNGAGKSSLLRACAGLLAVTSGRAGVLGHDLRRDRRSVRRQVALVGHATFLYDDLSVADNVRFSVRAAGVDPARVEDALTRLGLDGRLRATSVGRLSAGQRRRVALAALLARHPQLWLLDEPHAGLDAEGRDVLDQAFTHAAGLGATVILASHEADRAEALAQRVVTMGGGRIRADASRAAASRAAASRAATGPAITSPTGERLGVA